ncbi:MAG: hypothetical protein QM775_35090 [Pirellulales bacterium]
MLARTARRDEQTIVEAITRVVSVDLVADPASTQGLYESQQATEARGGDVSLAQATLEDVRRLRPDLLAPPSSDKPRSRDQQLVEQERDARGGAGVCDAATFVRAIRR